MAHFAQKGLGLLRLSFGLGANQDIAAVSAVSAFALVLWAGLAAVSAFALVLWAGREPGFSCCVCFCACPLGWARTRI